MKTNNKIQSKISNMIKLVVEDFPLDIVLTRDSCPGKRIKIDREILYAVDFQLFILLCCKVLPYSSFTAWQISGGVNFKYNYFIKREMWPPSDIIWRPGPELSLSVPLPVKQGGRIVVRDSWMRPDTTMSPILSWGSRIEEAYLPIPPLFSAPARGKSPS